MAKTSNLIEPSPRGDLCAVCFRFLGAVVSIGSMVRSSAGCSIVSVVMGMLCELRVRFSELKGRPDTGRHAYPYHDAQTIDCAL
jgi:hypothetical protein